MKHFTYCNESITTRATNILVRIISNENITVLMKICSTKHDKITTKFSEWLDLDSLDLLILANV